MKPLPKVLLPERIALDKIWGGRVLARRFGLDLPRIGETWECFDRGPTSSSAIANLDAATTLHELATQRTEELLGAAPLDEFGRFPLMLKFLDATQRLSLQVHPNDAFARELDVGDPGKTEAWFVVDATDDATLVCGYDATPEVLCRALAEGRDTESLLHRVDARRGDVVAIPPGTVHSVGAGYVLYEIQQNSDITLRLYDWGRVGDDGNPRELHLRDGRRAIEAAETRTAPETPRIAEADGVDLLVTNDRFVLRELRLEGTREIELGRTCVLVTPIEGRVALDTVELAELRTGLVPAATRSVRIEARDAKAVVLVASPAEEDGFRIGWPLPSSGTPQTSGWISSRVMISKTR